MIPFSTWRELYKIPWLRENKKAVGILSDIFYLLVALYRSNRMQEFVSISILYFQMIDSFAQYGRSEAKDTLTQVLRIAWFRDNHRDVYRLIAAYNRVIETLQRDDAEFTTVSMQRHLKRDMQTFFSALKSLIHFDQRDDGRVERLLQRSDLEAIIESIHRQLG